MVFLSLIIDKVNVGANLFPGKPSPCYWCWGRFLIIGLADQLLLSYSKSICMVQTCFQVNLFPCYWYGFRFLITGIMDQLLWVNLLPCCGYGSRFLITCVLDQFCCC